MEHHATVGRRARLPTEPGPEAMAGYNSPILTSPIKSPPYNSTGTDSDDNSCKCKFDICANNENNCLFNN